MALLLERQRLPARSAERAGAEQAGTFPRLVHVWAAAAVVAAALGSAFQPLEPIDYWWCVRLGDLIRATGVIPTDDPLTYTPIRGPIVDGQWLAKVLLSWLHQVGGVEVTLALRSIVAIAVAILLVRASRAAGAGPRSAAACAGLAVMLFVPGLAVRPQLFAVLPFLIIWQAALGPPRRTPAFVGVAAVTVFWANVHGSFILFVPLLAAGLLEAVLNRRRTGKSGRLRRWAVLAALCCMAPLLNPYGPGLTAYVADTVLVNGGGTSVGILGVEWSPPVLRSAYGGAFFASALLVMGLLAAGKRPRPAEALLLLGFGLLAVSSIRHILWWSLVLTPYVARAAGELASAALRRVRLDPGPLADGSVRLNAVCLVALGLLVMLSLPWWRTRLPTARTALIDPETPVAVGEYLAAHPTPGRLFNDTNWSAYFSWRLGDGVQVFVDNRFELHPPEVWNEYSTIAHGQVTWERRLDGYGVTRLALDPKTQPGLVEAVKESPRWKLVYEDRQALVFDRLSSSAGSEARASLAGGGPAATP